MHYATLTHCKSLCVMPKIAILYVYKKNNVNKLCTATDGQLPTSIKLILQYKAFKNSEIDHESYNI